MMEKSDEFDKWRVIRQSFPFQSFPVNTFPMKATINSSKFCSSKFNSDMLDSSNFVRLPVSKFYAIQYLLIVHIHTAVRSY